jgi:hypothetical protein
MSNDKKLHTSFYIERGLQDSIKIQIIQKKKWSKFNDYVIEALKEKYEREQTK